MTDFELLEKAFPGGFLNDPLATDSLLLDHARQFGGSILEDDPLAINEGWRLLKATSGWRWDTPEPFLTEAVNEEITERIKLLGLAVGTIASGPLADEIVIPVLREIRDGCIGWRGLPRRKTGEVILKALVDTRSAFPWRHKPAFYIRTAKNIFDEGSDWELQKLMKQEVYKPATPAVFDSLQTP